MKAGKLAIATALGADIADIAKYQREPGVFTDGEAYYFSRAVGGVAALPAGYDWRTCAEWMQRVYSIEVFRATGEDEGGAK